jgi:glycosyltransferase involved in cell wall biosynthesis
VTLTGTISVCFPVSGKESLSEASLRSLGDQTFRDFELIVACEDPDSFAGQFAEQLSKMSHRLIAQPARPFPAESFNTCLRACTGEFIKFVQPGDVLDPNCLSTMLAATGKNENVSLVSAPARYMNDDGVVIKRLLSPQLIGFETGDRVIELTMHEMRNMIGSVSQVLFARRFAFDGFRESMYAHADLELWLRILVHGNYFALSQPVVSLRNYAAAEQKSRLEESMLLLHDIVLLKESLTEFAEHQGFTEKFWSSQTSEAMENIFAEITQKNGLDRQLVGHAASSLAETLDEAALRLVVRDLAELVYDRSERLRKLTQPNSDETLRRQVRLLRRELTALGESVSWKCTAPLRTIKALVVKTDGDGAEDWGDEPEIPLYARDSHELKLQEEARDLHSQIRRISRSASWKLTAPFRVAGNRFGVGPRSASHVSKQIEAGLVVVDDIFPCKLSSFRYEEYLRYLNEFPDCNVLSTGQSLPLLAPDSSLRGELAKFALEHPGLSRRVHEYRPLTNVRAALGYCVFVSLAQKFQHFFEVNQIPFVFTLYPGGNFKLGNAKTNAGLRRVFSSPMFRGVITTQRLTTNYLLEGHFCTKERITEVIGAVLPRIYDSASWSEKRLFGEHKESLDICFVAYRYTAAGKEKGYDLFVEVAKRIAAMHPNAFFHVVGGFTYSDQDVSQIGDRIKFYGKMETSRMRAFYRNMDVIVSPTRPTAGVFDGFPTAASMEAGMSGVAVMCSDLLNQNVLLENHRDIVIINNEVDQIVANLDEYLKDPSRLYALSQAGQVSFQKYFGNEAQMRPRLQLLSSTLATVR